MRLYQQGNISLISVILVLAIFSGYINSLFELKNNHLSIKNRLKLYLCFKYLNKATKKYIKRMNAYNGVIQVTNAMKLNPKTTAAAQTTQKLTIVLQNLYHLSYVKKIISNRYCTSTQPFFYIKKIPYQTKTLFKLQRGPDKTTELRKKKWQVYLTFPVKKLKKISATKKITLKAQFKVKSKYSLKVSFTSEERGLMVLPFWK